MKTAVCLSGIMCGIENFESLKKNIIDPYGADVFIDTWLPVDNIPHIDIHEYVDLYRPKMLNMEHFDAVPITHQIRSILPTKTKTIAGNDSLGTKRDNVLFMWYKIWKSNQMRKQYEQTNRVRYDCIIRARFDSSFMQFPVIEPRYKTLYVPVEGDYEGGLNDQCALADSQTMDLYCDLYNDIYRYAVGGITIHPESMLRKHTEINRLTIKRFTTGMMLRGKPVAFSAEDLYNVMPTHEPELNRIHGKPIPNEDNL